MRTIPLLAGLSLGLAGCAEPDDGLGRRPVSGSVTLDGAPLATGLITFVPVGAPEPVASAPIRDGRYSLGRTEGPAPGPHRVTVWASEPTGKQIPDPDVPGDVIDELRELIPARYNVASTLTADVLPDGENTFAFELDGDPAGHPAGRSASGKRPGSSR